MLAQRNRLSASADRSAHDRIVGVGTDACTEYVHQLPDTPADGIAPVEGFARAPAVSR
jgi:hypothetical protein